MDSYDIIIVGSGMAGLYSAFTIQQKSPNTSFLILEKYKKNWIGGRASNDQFYGSEVVTGAGIGRRRKDKILHHLVKYFQLPTKNFEVNPTLLTSYPDFPVKDTIQYLRKEYKKHNSKYQGMTFKQFGEDVLGYKFYKMFVESLGYTDYEKEDVYETLYHYGLEDNTCCWNAFSVPWKKLVQSLYQSIGEKHFEFSSKVTKIVDTKRTADETPGDFSLLINTENGKQYQCNKLILATTIDTVRELLPLPIYNDIESQPFLRLYAKFNKESALILKRYIHGFTFVSTSLQRLLPTDPNNGVYMIAYNDNKNTLALKDHLQNTKENRTFFEELVERTLQLPKGTLHIISLKPYYWKVGTHYYKPLNRKLYQSREEFIYQAQHPEKNILVVGEMISMNQGWTEGALESVKTALTKAWITRS